MDEIWTAVTIDTDTITFNVVKDGEETRSETMAIPEFGDWITRGGYQLVFAALCLMRPVPWSLRKTARGALYAHDGL